MLELITPRCKRGAGGHENNLLILQKRIKNA